MTVPKLRFPEFRDAGEWEEKEVGEIFNVTRGEVLSMTLVRDAKTDDAPYPVFSSQTKNNGLAGFYSQYLYEDAITWTTDGANAGDVNYRQGKFYCTNVCGVLLNKDGYANPCIAALINSVSRKYVSYVGNPKLMNGVMSKIVIPFPSPSEQQKIADCLSSIADRITAETQKLDTLKAHKKGLMQQLFPAEGETLPKLRFPEFRDVGEWKPLPIGEKVDLLSGYSFDGVDISEDSLGVRLLRGINITEGVIRHSQDIDRYYLGSTEKLEKYTLQDNDLVIGMDGSKVGKNSALITSLDSGALLVQRVARLRTDCLASIQFIFQQINSTKFHAYVDRINTSSGIPHISAKQINDFQVCFPCAEEQQKIADCLISLDELIAAQTQAIDTLKTHKKGLMQQLFPSVEEVKG